MKLFEVQIMMEATLEESRNYLLERREEIIQKVRYLIKQTHNPTRDEVDNKLKCKSIYIQFKENILPFSYNEMPGFKQITAILKLADKGLIFRSENNNALIIKINSL